MSNNLSARRLLLMPLWAAQLATGAKSFADNPLIGSRWLNERGLHTVRVRAAHHLAWRRRARLAHLIAESDRAAFDRDGFVLRPDFLSPDMFGPLLNQLQAYRGPVREQVQGGAVTRRIALSPSVLKAIPAAAAAVLANPGWRGLIRYAGSFDAEPLTYVQTILSHGGIGQDDPQCEVHQDTFHSSVKAWLFLTDVAIEDGPFTYVPGSHRLTPARLAWERRMSLNMSPDTARLTRRGSFRASAADLREMGLPPPRAFTVAANTLVVADTYGFHARGPSSRPSKRVEIFASGRRNPFLPWTGLDAFSIGAIGHRRMPLFWGWGDALQAAGVKQSPWRKRIGTAFDDAG